MSKNIRSTLLVLALCILGGINLAGCSSGNVPPPDIVDAWKLPEGIDETSPVSCEKNRSLFAYDEEAPLDIQEVSRRREEGVTVIDLSYASPKGGRVPATLVVPNGSGPFAGMIYQHGMPATRQHLIPGAVIYARMGAIVILIDAPFARPEHGSAEPLTFTEQDRREQIQLIIDLRRAVDLLLSRSDVDPQRLAYVGISYGGAMGGLLAGVENRIKGYVLQVGDGGLVTHFTGVEDRDWWQAKPEEVRRQWVAWMWPIEPIHYVACANPAELLFQNGTLDRAVPPADALRYQEAGSEPKTILRYENGHGLGVAAGRDQAEWLSKVIGIASHRPLPRSVEIVLNVWFILVAGSLAIITWTLWRTRSVAYGARLMWLLTTAFLGPLGLSIYWISSRSSQGTKESAAQGSIFRRSLGSAAWASTGNMLGGIGVIALLLYLPGIFGAYLALQIAAVFFLPFCAGWLVFVVSKWISRTDANYALSYRRSVFAEAVSTCWALVGIYPTVTIINGQAIERWTVPFRFDLSYPPLWAVLCLAVFVGTMTTLPFHLWMIRRGEIRWGSTNPLDEGNLKGPPWYWQVSLLAVSFAVMLGAIFLSMQIA
jgi:dienelactone hydrolase